MRDAGLGVGLVARAGADPEPIDDRADVVDLLGDHALAGVELGQHVVLHAPDRIACAEARPARLPPYRCGRHELATLETAPGGKTTSFLIADISGYTGYLNDVSSTTGSG